jgi:pimeloyl-ACP methyl ester carboxylesterase
LHNGDDVDALTTLLWTLFWIVAGLAAAIVLFMAWAIVNYGKYIDHVLRWKPLLIAENQPHREGGERVEATTASGRRLSGSYFHHSSARRRGVIAFCHEYAGDRWLFEDYVGPLLVSGFDVCAFDFCNHGKSEAVAGYEPSQWVTTHEVQDVMAVVDALGARSDADPQGVALVGVSKGGGAALAAAAERPSVWAVVMDGAYPNHGMVVEYMTKWVGIFSSVPAIYTRLPNAFFQLMCEWGLYRMAQRNGVTYVRLERALRAIGSRPVFMIRGARDNYVTKTIIDEWFAKGDARNKERWEVAAAKHNRCVERAKSDYQKRLIEFFDKFSPVPPVEAVPAPEVPLERPTAERRPEPAPSA